MKELIRIHEELNNKFKGYPQISSWRGFLNAHYEIASEAKNYTRAAHINDLVRFDIESPGPHTKEELNRLINN